VASRLAVDTIVDAVVLGDARGPFAPDSAITEGGTLLRNAVHTANGRILEAARALPDYAGMGTTVVAALARGPLLSVVHVGDSRLYLHDGERLRQLTTDDSWMASMLASDPEADPLALQRHPLRNALTNVVGSRAEVHVHLLELPLCGDEVLLLTTDGVHGALDAARLETIVTEARRGALERLAGDVVAAALDRGSRDNCTAIVARCETSPA
jgi:protein phosphatase